MFALDITEPEFEEDDAGQALLWEFSDDRAVATPSVAAAARLGYTYGKPNIVRLHHGKWAVLLPGGFNNQQADGIAGDGSSSLFVLDAETGDLIREINIPGSYGLAFATAGNVDNDAVDDFAVAGDVIGNLWRFDLSSSDPAQWDAELLFTAPATEQNPISSAPRIFGDTQTGGAIIIFGTGKLIEPADGLPVPPAAAPQRIYAIRDRGPGHASYPRDIDDLQQHGFVEKMVGEQRHYEIEADPLPSAAGGWYIDLPETGERVINAPGALFSQGLVLITTVIPNQNNPCNPALAGNLFVLSAASGSAPELGAMFDTDDDGDVDGNDSQVASGIALERSLAEGTPAVVAAVGGGISAMPDIPNVRLPEPLWRRRHWRELP